MSDGIAAWQCRQCGSINYFVDLRSQCTGVFAIPRGSSCKKRTLVLDTFVEPSIPACVDGLLEFSLIPAIDEVSMKAVASRIAVREHQRLLSISVELIEFVDPLVEVVILKVKMRQFVRMGARARAEVLSTAGGIRDMVLVISRVYSHAIPAHWEADLRAHPLGALDSRDVLRFGNTRACTGPGDCLGCVISTG